MDKGSTGAKKSKSISMPDTLTRTSKKGRVELTVGEMDKVSGGAPYKQLVPGNSKWTAVTLKRGITQDE